MTLPPAWKLAREVRRLRDDAWRGTRAVLWEPARQWLHDRAPGGGARVQRGDRPLTGRVAILVLFQPAGLAPSLRLTLDHLDTEGWSVVAVSNAPLTAGDADGLRRGAALVLERPNVGYDFGGYRAGLRLLARQGHQPERLIVMNDSSWFPLRAGDTTLRRMEALDTDVAGHIHKTEAGRGNDHLESHLLMFGPRALAHPAFARFWARYVMSDDRITTIRRGEKGLSRAMRAAGLRLAGLIDRDGLRARLEGLDDAQLAEVLDSVVHHRPDAAAHCAAIAAAARGRDWRAEFLDWVEGALANSRQHLVAATFIEPAMRLCAMGFVKKARDTRFHLARARVLEMEAAGRIAPLHPAVHAEIAAAVARWHPPPP